MSEPTTIQIERGTLILINDKPYKVFLEPNNGLVEEELKALDAAGINNSMVGCQNIPIVSNKVYA